MSQATSIQALLQKTEHYDKDERYMATSDLCDALKRHATATAMNQSGDKLMTDSSSSSNNNNNHTQTIDTASETKICEAVLRLVDDSSNDVQAIAVKTLGVLVTSVHEDQVVAIAERLGSLVLDETPAKSLLRDVYTIGLRTLVKTVPMNMGDIVSHRLAAGLMDGIRKHSKNITVPSSSSNANTTKAEKDKCKVAEEITLACLEVLTDLLTRFGSLSFITRQHKELMEVTLRQLASESHLVRKRSGNTIGCLAIVISDTLLYRLVESLLSQIDRADGVGKSGKRRSRRIAASTSTSSTNKAASVVEDDILKDCKPKDTKALIRTMCTVAGVVGHRLGQQQIDRLFPIFLRFCDPMDACAGDDEEEEEDDEMEEESEEEDEAAIVLANELRESCFTGFESFVLRRPVQIKPHLPLIVDAALAYLRHDPNYSYGDENESEDAADGDGDGDNNGDVSGDNGAEEDDYDMDDEEEDYEDDDDDYGDDSDDDDDSWKVRRSAIRTLSAVVEASKSDMSKLWTTEFSWKKNKKWKITVAGALVQRFKERDENCRVDIIECFNKLLSNTVDAAAAGDIILASADANYMDTTTNDDDASQSQTTIDLRTKYVPTIVDGCEKQLSAKKAGDRTKSAAFSLLSSLCKVPGGMGNASQIKVIFGYVKSILSQSSGGVSGQASNKSLKLDCLCFVHVILSASNHSAVDVKDALIEVLLSELCKTLQEKWYKIISETLTVLSVIPDIVEKANASSSEKEQVAGALYEAIEPHVAVHDADQEIKECSLVSASSLISTMHASMSQTMKERLLSLILLRLKNETTRLHAIRSISSFAVEKNPGSGKIDMSPIITEVVTELSSLLRQNSRSIKQSSLQCLSLVVRSQSKGLDVGILGNVVKELSANIVESDLHVSHLCLQASLAVLETSTSSNEEIKDHLLPAVLDLSKSSILQDKALESLLAVLENLVSSRAVAFDDLLTALRARLPLTHDGDTIVGSSKQSISSLAKSIAAITAAASEADRNNVVEDLLSSLEVPVTQETAHKAQLALRVAGDLGRVIQLSAMPGVSERLQKTFMISFDSPYEDIKNASAYGLGRSCVGSMEAFLPNILDALEKNDKNKQYLLLAALRELIYCHQQGFGGDISPSIQQILPHLKTHLADKEEGVRTMVADCLGCLACLEPDVILPELQKLADENCGDKDPITCTAVATAMKYAIAGKCDADVTLPFMPTFLKLLKESDLVVKNAGLLMIYSAIHHNPKLVLGYMQAKIIPSLHELAQLSEKRVIDLGPFKQTVDDALPVRKAALSIFSTCLDQCPDLIDISDFIPILAKALGDVEDIQLQSHQILMAMCPRYPAEILSSVESFVDPLEKTINKKMGSKRGTELERATEWVKSAMRVMIMLSKTSDAMLNQKFANMVARIRRAEKHKQLLRELGDECE